MKKPIKFFALFITLFVVSLCFGIHAYAAESTLGEESPYLYCVFYDDNGEQVDGNTLAAGDYTVDVMLEGMARVSVFEYTAEYDPGIVTDLTTEAVITAEQQDMSLGGIKTAQADNGKMRVAIAMASTDENGSILDQDGATTIATMSMTVTAGGPIDFRDYFRFVTDPDLTFAEADYNDGIEDAYVLDTATDTSYATYLMTADESPSFGEKTITVSGRVVWATAVDGTAEGTLGEEVFGARGIKFQRKNGSDAWIDVVDENGSVIETAADATDNYGSFTITVPVGTTEIRVVGYNPAVLDEETGLPIEIGLPRIVTLSGKADVANAYIPYIICDYNGSGTMNVSDNSDFTDNYEEKTFFADLNNSDTWNVSDKDLYGNFKNKGIAYQNTLELDS